METALASILPQPIQTFILWWSLLVWCCDEWLSSSATPFYHPFCRSVPASPFVSFFFRHLCWCLQCVFFVRQSFLFAAFLEAPIFSDSFDGFRLVRFVPVPNLWVSEPFGLNIGRLGFLFCLRRLFRFVGDPSPVSCLLLLDPRLLGFVFSDLGWCALFMY